MQKSEISGRKRVFLVSSIFRKTYCKHKISPGKSGASPFIIRFIQGCLRYNSINFLAKLIINYVFLGQWSDWDDWSACSAECQLGSQSPTRYRNRTCEGFTFNGTCPPLVLNGISYYGSQTENCNSEKPCNGMSNFFIKFD